MRLLGIIILAVSLGGCTVAIGPVKMKIWERASLELSDTLFGSLCIGCLEPGVDPNCPVPDGN